MIGVKRKIRSSTNPIVGPSLEDLLIRDLSTLENVLAKALWVKESTTDSNNNSTIKKLGQQMVPIIQELILCYLCIKKSLFTTNLLRME